jgi:hypothetical protein
MNAIENTIHAALISVTGVGFIGLVTHIITMAVHFGR